LKKLIEARENQVITNLGKTRRYIVEDGLDQGSPLSPTLWRIYYDPLIARIAKEFKGYKMETTIPGGRTLECSMLVLAYMDDSLWVADNLEELQKIVDTASSFYKLTKIKVNPAKSVFATNSKKEGDIIFEGGVMERRDQKEPFRYLGCWFGVLEKQKEVREKIIEEANQAIKRLNRARITEKQYIYITNCVLLTRIAYRTQNVVLGENICTEITKRYMKGIKQKARLARSVPDSMLTNHNLYSVKKVKDIQAMQHITQMWKEMNSEEFEGSPLYINLQNLQNAATTNVSILEERPVFPIEYTKIRTAAIIENMHQAEIQLIRGERRWPRCLEEEGTPINRLLENHGKKNTIKSKLNKHKIYYKEQFMNSDGTKLLEWGEIFHNIRKIIKGRQPKWFTEIKEIIREQENPSIENNGPNPFTVNKVSKGNESMLKGSWVQTNNGLIGRVLEVKENILRLSHWNVDKNIITGKCRGCLAHIATKTTTGLIRKKTQDVTRIIVNRKKKIYSNIEDISKAFKVKKKEEKIIPREVF